MLLLNYSRFGLGIGDGAVTAGKRSGGFKVGVIPGATLNTTGNKSITDVGFKPKYVEFKSLVVSGNGTYHAYGASDGTSQYIKGSGMSGASNNSIARSDACLGYASAGGTWAQLGTLVSFDNDGFTVAVSVAASQDIAYIAFG